MNRLIKFRGYSIERKEWLYGSLFVEQSGDVSISDPRYGTFHDVAPESVGQFTGLHDKNGKEIYEGDVISRGVSTKEKRLICWPVVWYVDSFRIGRHDKSPSRVGQSWWQYSEIIGNIYEHPNLIPCPPNSNTTRSSIV